MKKYILTLALTIVSLASLTSFAQAQEYTFSRDLSAGVSGDDVTALQSWLISSGFDIPAISSNSAMKGYFGSQTRLALMKYQLSIGLPNTGYFGPLTRGRIHGSYRGNSLVVTSPNGGEVWKKGTVQNITWNSVIKPGLTERFNHTADIRLSFPLPACAKPGANPVCMIAVRAPYTIAKGVSLSGGAYSWNVGGFIFDPAAVPYCSSVSTSGDCINPSPLVEDGKYIVQVCPTNGSECDESNGEFTIASGDLSVGELKVTSPNGGEVWQANSNQAITWAIDGNVDANTKVDISLYTDTPCPAGYSCSPLPPYVLDKNIAYNSTYYWITATDINNKKIPDNTYYKILVCISGTSKCDRSDSVFTITSSQLLQVCPSQKIVNQMPTVYPNQNPPSTYYILNGVRRELTEFDQNWVGANCAVPTQTVY